MNYSEKDNFKIQTSVHVEKAHQDSIWNELNITAEVLENLMIAVEGLEKRLERLVIEQYPEVDRGQCHREPPSGHSELFVRLFNNNVRLVGLTQKLSELQESIDL